MGPAHRRRGVWLERINPPKGPESCRGVLGCFADRIQDLAHRYIAQVQGHARSPDWSHHGTSSPSGLAGSRGGSQALVEFWDKTLGRAQDATWRLIYDIEALHTDIENVFWVCLSPLGIDVDQVSPSNLVLVIGRFAKHLLERLPKSAIGGEVQADNRLLALFEADFNPKEHPAFPHLNTDFRKRFCQRNSVSHQRLRRKGELQQS